MTIKKKPLIIAISIIIAILVLISLFFINVLVVSTNNSNYLNSNLNNVKITRTGIFVSQQSAQELALQAVGSGEVLYVDPDLIDLTPSYSVKVVSNGVPYSVKVGAITGRVVSLEMDY